jgi:hypothetical protein
MNHITVNILIENINVSGSKLPCAYPALKEDIQLGKRAAARFRHTEVGVNNAEEANRGLKGALFNGRN